jgi:hypothetical protein
MLPKAARGKTDVVMFPAPGEPACRAPDLYRCGVYQFFCTGLKHQLSRPEGGRLRVFLAFRGVLYFEKKAERLILKRVLID